MIELVMRRSTIEFTIEWNEDSYPILNSDQLFLPKLPTLKIDLASSSQPADSGFLFVCFFLLHTPTPPYCTTVHPTPAIQQPARTGAVKFRVSGQAASHHAATSYTDFRACNILMHKIHDRPRHIGP